jgi:hypothetical protein
MTMRPTVQLVGDVDHADFRRATNMLRAMAHVIDAAANVPPELIVVAQSRPGAVAHLEVLQLQRRAPLAGVVALLGTWCEGETRTGRPWPGVARLYWYEFPAWWQRQVDLRAAGRCPDWARPDDFDCALRIADCEFGSTSSIPQAPTLNRQSGVIVLCVARRDTRDALAEVLREAGYATVWHRFGRPECEVHGAAAGIWDGGQLDEREASELATFCRRLSRDAAPVVAMLDFPRRERVDEALQLGAAAALGKPWRNDELNPKLQAVTAKESIQRAA